MRIVKLIIQSPQRAKYWKEGLAKMGAVELKFEGFLAKNHYLQDFQCPHCQQFISEPDIAKKNYMLWVSDYANEVSKEHSLGSTYYGLSFWLKSVEHQDCPDTETCERCGEALLLTHLKEFNGAYYCFACFAEVNHE